jgi:hypothetical protein
MTTPPFEKAEREGVSVCDYRWSVDGAGSPLATLRAIVHPFLGHRQDLFT